MTGKKEAAALLCLLLAGCSHPIVKLDALTYQSKVEELADWDALADRQAERMAITLADAGTASTAVQGFVLPGSAPRNRFYIAAGGSQFALSFKPLLEKHLLQRGLEVSQVPNGSWVVELDAQTFLYDPETSTKRLVEYATFWSTVYALGVAVRNVSSIDTSALIIAGAGPAVDLLAALNARTNAEVLMVLTAADPQRVYYHSTEAFYVRPSDLPLYLEERRGSLTVVSLPVRAGL